MLSASSRCSCGCISSIFHFCMSFFLANMPLCHYHFFDVLLLLLFHSLPHLSFVFSVSRQGSLELCISFPLLWHYRLSFCHFALFLQPQLLFLLSPQVLFNVTQICIYLTCFFFISHLCSKFFAQKRISYSDRSLRHFELGMVKAVQIVRYFIPNLASCNASFLCLGWFKNENLLTKKIVMFSPLHVGSKDKNKMLTLIFFLFVLHVVCLFFFTASRTLFCSPNMQDTFTNINNQ